MRFLSFTFLSLYLVFNKKNYNILKEKCCYEILIKTMTFLMADASLVK